MRTPPGGAASVHLKQLVDNVAVINGGNGPTGVVLESDVWIDAEHAEDRVVDVAWSQRSILRNFAQAIRRSDDLAAAHTATTHQY